MQKKINTVTIHRQASGPESTFGIVTIDGVFECFALEDQGQPGGKKVHGETRIPAGRYTVYLRNEGGMNQRYAKRYPDFHVGMLGITNWSDDKIVDTDTGNEWQYVMFHAGNTDDDTLGCPLLGDSVIRATEEKHWTLQNSRSAYVRFYRKVSKMLTDGEYVGLHVIDP